MILATIVVQTLPGRAPAVRERLAEIEGLGSMRLDGDHRIEGTWRLPEDDTAEGLSEALRGMDADIVAVYPTFLDRAFE